MSKIDMSKSIGIRLKTVLARSKSKTGFTVPELAAKVVASPDSTRRAINRGLNEGAFDYADEYKKCKVTGQDLYAYLAA